MKANCRPSGEKLMGPCGPTGSLRGGPPSTGIIVSDGFAFVRLSSDAVNVLAVWRERQPPIRDRCRRCDLHIALRRDLFEPKALPFNILQDVDDVLAVGRHGGQRRTTGIRELVQFNRSEWNGRCVLSMCQKLISR